MKIYIKSVISILLLTCMAAAVSANEFNLYNESSLGDYDTVGYSDWDRLKSTNNTAFVKKYFEERERICKHLEFLGVKLDLELNKTRGKEACISTEDSKVKVYIVPTNEEIMIARDTYKLVN